MSGTDAKGNIYESARLIDNIQISADGAASAQILHDAAVGQYMFQAYAGSNLFIQHFPYIERPTAGATSPVPLGRWFCFVPSNIDRVVANIKFLSLSESDLTAKTQILMSDVAGNISSGSVSFNRVEGTNQVRAFYRIPEQTDISYDQFLFIDVAMCLVDTNDETSLFEFSPVLVSAWTEAV